MSVRPWAHTRIFGAAAERRGEGSVSFVSASVADHAEIFSAPDRSGWDGEDWQAAYEERVAILEYEEGLPRAEAETLARKQVMAMIEASVKVPCNGNKLPHW